MERCIADTRLVGDPARDIGRTERWQEVAARPQRIPGVRQLIEGGRAMVERLLLDLSVGQQGDRHQCPPCPPEPGTPWIKPRAALLCKTGGDRDDSRENPEQRCRRNQPQPVSISHLLLRRPREGSTRPS